MSTCFTANLWSKADSDRSEDLVKKKAARRPETTCSKDLQGENISKMFRPLKLSLPAEPQSMTAILNTFSLILLKISFFLYKMFVPTFHYIIYYTHLLSLLSLLIYHENHTDPSPPASVKDSRAQKRLVFPFSKLLCAPPRCTQ